MKAIIVKEAGGIDKLIHTTLPVPEIKEGEVLVAVKAISINPVDVKTRAGKGQFSKLVAEGPIILGWDISGIVTASRSSLFKEGDEVFGMVNFPGHGKAYAEYVAAPADQLAHKPAGISHEEAAAATLAALTALQALNSTQINPSDKVLIHAAAGGVGHYAVQLAKEAGAYVIGTASAANRDFVLGLGADEHFDYKSGAFEDHYHDLDLVLDAMGGEYIDRSLKVLRPQGTIISLPSGLRETVEEKATAQGKKGYFITVASSGKDMRRLADLLECGRLKSHVSAVFNFEDMAKAHQQIESNSTRGKVVVAL
ncbi:NADP-dependent oxidoreductase [Chitinophaga varians]|uniref:NADP-dependent oxidoreductase n=1 Tax=Chitinophaga varians TaxID=2202339 RepID=A0A847S840_9BACT|nr:NADP-dependent oxidoreductase [Chitinophaga varians]NLR68927.1 NADP-dependent oxidoreductase [Chitinophaga varians]